MSDGTSAERGDFLMKSLSIQKKMALRMGTTGGAILLAGCMTFDAGKFADLNDTENAVVPQDKGQPIPVDLLDTEHKLVMGDQVSFRIVEDREDPKKLFITDSGELEIPLIGRVQAEGKTCSRLAAEIKALLESKFYYKATVVVSVDIKNKTRGKIYLAGRIRAPGYLEIPTDEVFTVSKAILRAGGFSEFADKRHVKVTHKNASRSAQTDAEIVTVDIAEVLEKGQSGKDFELHPDDRVFVPSRLINF
jgi:protein involved in polysaccharide export with SLBB domain